MYTPTLHGYLSPALHGGLCGCRIVPIPWYAASMSTLPVPVAHAAVASLTDDQIKDLAGDRIAVQFAECGVAEIDVNADAPEDSSEDDPTPYAGDDHTRPLLVSDRRLYQLTLYVPGYALPIPFHHLPIPVHDYPVIVDAAAEHPVQVFHDLVLPFLTDVKVGLRARDADLLDQFAVARGKVLGFNGSRIIRSMQQYSGSVDAAEGCIVVLSQDGDPCYREVYPGHLTPDMARAWCGGGITGLWPYLATDLPLHTITPDAP